MRMQLPDEFTYQQVIDLRVARGMDKKETEMSMRLGVELQGYAHYVK